MFTSRPEAPKEPMPIKTLHLTNAFHPQSGGISTFYMAMLNMIGQRAIFANDRIAVGMPVGQRR